MQWITLVIFLGISATTYGLSCLATNDGKPLQVSLESSDSDGVIQMLGELKSPDYGAILCRVELLIDSDIKLLQIQFVGHLADSGLEVLKDQHIRIDLFVMGRSSIGVTNIIEYACSYNGCDLKFFKDHIDWLMTTDYPELPNKLKTLISGDGKIGGE